MKKTLITMASCITLANGIMSCHSNQSSLNMEHQNDSLTLIHISHPKKYLLLPIQESSDEAKVKLNTGKADDMAFDIRLATDSVEYYVPFELPENADIATVTVEKVNRQAICWAHIQQSDTFDTSNKDYYRPVYHHTPLYGWMNDANGLVYKDGEYHLYYQYNPYGSRWGNMHWGHSVSRDLIHWEHLKPAIARDTLGHIFSGSTIVDKFNSAGFGKDALIAFYTSASDEHGQLQCLAYSTDNGRTYTKYDQNPILTPFDGLKDFRDPKVFWYEPMKKWYMIVSADKEMRFYSSSDLKDWEYLSAFGEGYGIQPNQFECPDFVQLPVDGDSTRMKWAMIVNINPGCLFGGSATEYFIGEFDGKSFTCDTKPEITKFLDYGKDHYATVCFSNTGNRTIAVPWMSNWQYANVTPIKQYRGANALPRELSLFTQDGEIYMASDVIKESGLLRKNTRNLNDFSIENEYVIGDAFANCKEGAFQIEMDFTPGNTQTAGFEMLNSKGEKTKIYFDMAKNRLVMDRTESGLIPFGEQSEPHAKENHDRRKTESVNYINDFALGTWAPLSLCKGKTYHLNIFVDKCSVEIFVDNGRIAMTNLIFPTVPYDGLRFYSEKGKAEVKNLRISELGL